MAETLCDSGAVKLAAGLNAPTGATNVPATMTQFINQAEGDIVADTRVNWLDIYSTMNADFKQILEGACAAKAALKVIRYDPAVYTSRGEANFMANICAWEYQKAIRILSDDKVITALGASLITS